MISLLVKPLLQTPEQMLARADDTERFADSVASEEQRALFLMIAQKWRALAGL
jgi:hypothetical protein